MSNATHSLTTQKKPPTKTKPNLCFRRAAVIPRIVLLLVGAVASKGAIMINNEAVTNGVPAFAPDPTSVEDGSWNLTAANIKAS